MGLTPSVWSSKLCRLCSKNFFFHLNWFPQLLGLLSQNFTSMSPYFQAFLGRRSKYINPIFCETVASLIFSWACDSHQNQRYLLWYHLSHILWMDFEVRFHLVKWVSLWYPNLDLRFNPGWCWKRLGHLLDGDRQQGWWFRWGVVGTWCSTVYFLLDLTLYD